MPGHRTHDALTVAAAALLPPAYYLLAPSPRPATAAILAGACLISGVMFSPDLDLPSRSRRRWGPAGLLWAPYEKLVPHRSWISHGIVTGPLLRLVYFAGVLYLLLWILLWAVKEWLVPLDRNALVRSWRGSLVDFATRYPEWSMAALLGFILGAVVHTAADVIGSARPRRRRR